MLLTTYQIKTFSVRICRLKFSKTIVIECRLIIFGKFIQQARTIFVNDEMW